MPLTLVGEYLYFLMLVLLWGSPVIGVILWFGWRRARVAKALKTLVVLVPAAALAGQLVFRGVVLLTWLGYERQAKNIASYLGDAERADVVLGGFVGTLTGGSNGYRRYQFPSLDGSKEHVLEIVLPPDGLNAAASIGRVRDKAPYAAPARLILWPARIGDNPSMAPREFLDKHYPGEAPDAFGPHTLIVGLRPGQAIIVHPRQTGDRATWRWTEADFNP
jgi:hypothetical protein